MIGRGESRTIWGKLMTGGTDGSEEGERESGLRLCDGWV